MATGKLQIDKYRTVREKASLLDAAIRCVSGAIIARVVISLRRSLGPAPFFKLMRPRRTACLMYAQYLRQRKQYKELELLLSEVQLPSERYMFHLSQALDTEKSDVDIRLASLTSVIALAESNGKECCQCQEWCKYGGDWAA